MASILLLAPVTRERIYYVYVITVKCTFFFSAVAVSSNVSATKTFSNTLQNLLVHLHDPNFLFFFLFFVLYRYVFACLMYKNNRINICLHANWKKRIVNTLARSSHPELFFRKNVLEICNKFTGEHPCRSVISKKLLLQFYWNHASACVFSCKFGTYFQNTFS